MAERLRISTQETGKCKVCQHPQRGAIDGRLLKGNAFRAVAKSFGITESTIRNHVNHILPLLAKAKERQEKRTVGRMLNVYDEFIADLLAINKEIEKAKDDIVARQGWYAIKGKRLDTAFKYKLLSELLGAHPQNGNGKPTEPPPLPESVERMIHAIVNNDE